MPEFAGKVRLPTKLTDGKISLLRMNTVESTPLEYFHPSEHL
jgi:hypothetical protein